MPFSFADNIQYLILQGVDVARITKEGYAARLASRVRRAVEAGQPVPTRDILRGHPKPTSKPRVPATRKKFTTADNRRLLKKAGISLKGIKSERTIARLAAGVRRAEREGLKKTPNKSILYGGGNATYREYERKGHRLAQTAMFAKPRKDDSPANWPPHVPWIRTLQAGDLQQLLNLSHSEEEPLLVVIVGWCTTYPGREELEGDDDDPQTWQSEIATIRISTSSIQQWIRDALQGSDSYRVVDFVNDFYGADKGAHWTQIDQVSIAYRGGEK